MGEKGEEGKEEGESGEREGERQTEGEKRKGCDFFFIFWVLKGRGRMEILHILSFRLLFCCLEGR